MTQNINLLTEITLQPISALNSRLMVQICTGWILLLALIYVITFGINTNKQKNMAALALTQKNLIATLAVYTQTLSTIQNITLANLPIGSGSLIGFYRYLEDLASLTPHGTWLNYFNFSETDNSITLKGSTIAASGVSALLKSLDKVTLRNKRFSTLQLQENLETNNIDFVISTVEAGASPITANNPRATETTTGFTSSDISITTNKK